MALVILHCFAATGHPGRDRGAADGRGAACHLSQSSRGGDILWHAWSFIGA